MPIAAVEAIPFSLVRKVEIRARTTAGHASDHVLVRVRMDDGQVGVAEALARPGIYGETQASIVAIYRERISKSLVGLDPFDLEEANRRLAEIPANNTARAAADIALHDLWGRLVGAPLHRLWGGVWTEQVVSWTVGLNRPSVMADEAETMNRVHGISSFKVKGGEVPDDDVEAIRLIRGRLPDAQISLDANEGYSPRVAMRTLGRMEPFDLAYVEEPIARHDRRGRVEAARRITVPILGDDSCFTLADVVREIELGAIGMVSIKTPRTGFWESARIHATAEAHGLRCIVGTAVGGGLSSIAALQFSCSRQGLALPSENSFGINLESDIVVNAPSVEDGRLRLPEGDGLAAQVSDARLAELAAPPLGGWPSHRPRDG